MDELAAQWQVVIERRQERYGQLDIGMYIPVSRVVLRGRYGCRIQRREKQSNSEVEIPSRLAIFLSHRSCICRCYQLFKILRPIFASKSSVRGLDFHGLSTLLAWLQFIADVLRNHTAQSLIPLIDSRSVFVVFKPQGSNCEQSFTIIPQPLPCGRLEIQLDLRKWWTFRED